MTPWSARDDMDRLSKALFYSLARCWSERLGGMDLRQFVECGEVPSYLSNLQQCLRLARDLEDGAEPNYDQYEQLFESMISESE